MVVLRRHVSSWKWPMIFRAQSNWVRLSVCVCRLSREGDWEGDWQCDSLSTVDLSLHGDSLATSLPSRRGFCLAGASVSTVLLSLISNALQRICCLSRRRISLHDDSLATSLLSRRGFCLAGASVSTALQSRWFSSPWFRTQYRGSVVSPIEFYWIRRWRRYVFLHHIEYLYLFCCSCRSTSLDEDFVVVVDIGFSKFWIVFVICVDIWLWLPCLIVCLVFG